MITLALDLGGKTGYAIRYDTGHVKCGAWNLTRGDLGGRRSPIPMLRLHKRLTRLAECHAIERVVFEETFARGDAKYRLDSLQHAVIFFACSAGTRFRRIAVGSWKSEMLGHARCPRKEYWQAAIERWPEHVIHNDDIAAALWLLEYVKE